jgi:hypothetical protein
MFMQAPQGRTYHIEESDCWMEPRSSWRYVLHECCIINGDDNGDDNDGDHNDGVANILFVQFGTVFF